MSIITTRALGYTIDPGRDETDFVARLINPTPHRADIGFYDPGTGVLSIYTTDSNGEYQQFDSGYPTDDFLVAMRNYREESGLPVYQVMVEELGLAHVADSNSIDSPSKLMHKLKVMALEESKIIDASPRGYDSVNSRYIYKVTLENRHSFELKVRTPRSAASMVNVRHDGKRVIIDNVPCNIFDRYKDFDQHTEPEEFAEKITKRMEYLIKIYFNLQININLENQG
ncbi:hypothetical protein ACSQ5K_26590 [Pseudomonas sp. PhalM4]